MLEQPELLPPSADVAALRDALPQTNGRSNASAAARKPPDVQAAALREIQPAGPRFARGRPARQEPAISPAALLQQARTPDDLATVFRGMPRDHQRLRVRIWAAMSEEQLAAVEALTEESKADIRKVWLHVQVDRSLAARQMRLLRHGITGHVSN